jgi:maltooligosyltrehalose trehalohydrolase
MNIGAWYLDEKQCDFTVWAPHREKMEAIIAGTPERAVPLIKNDNGYWHATINGVTPGTSYRYRIDGSLERPDPASFFQPQGVHGPSSVVDHTAHRWRDKAWRGIALEQYIVYELHVGAFSHEGTFDGALAHLDHLIELGITAVELMPVAQFPGNRNWGYDGVHPFAVQNSYGGPLELKRFVDACHTKGLAVILDVVYNHLGPEGNYLWEYGPYFTRNKYRTPWGWAVNFDDAGSDQVREYFISNALYWLDTFHIDALRLDAVHAIIDLSAKHILQELAERVEAYNRTARWKRYLIAESDLNDSRLVRDRSVGGYGLDAQWSDDYHHALHAFFTGERKGYYADFGEPGQIATAIAEGFVYSGRYSPFRDRCHGNSAADLPPFRFVFFSQNHDQVGNRMLGERLSALVDCNTLKCISALILLSPQIPLLFMGEEWGESAPFPYFVRHGDPDLVAAVKKGRKEEFKGFVGEQEPPDPQSETTFESAKLGWLRVETCGAALLGWYRRLIEIRKAAGGACADVRDFNVALDSATMMLRLYRRTGPRRLFAFINLSASSTESKVVDNTGKWLKILDSADPEWGGNGVTAPEFFSAPAVITLPGRGVAVYAQSEPANARSMEAETAVKEMGGTIGMKERRGT